MNQENTGQKQTFWLKVGVFFAWAGGFAGVGVVMTTLLLLVVSIFQPTNFDNFFYHLSNWCFWMSSLLMFGGLLVPTEGTAADAGNKRRVATGQGRMVADAQASALDKWEARRQKAIDRRIARVYNPWRWRLWAAALIAFGITVLFGLLAKPMPSTIP